MAKLKDITDRKFGRLTVLRFSAMRNGKAHWQCQCECGEILDISGQSLKRGLSRSCGCLAKRNAATHGMSHYAEYQIWCGILQRCNDPNGKSFSRYGGRGITICNRWEQFVNFYADMGPRPSSEHSIDRIDNDAHYSCGRCPQCKKNMWSANCRWSSRVEQGSNKRNNHRVTYNGKSQTISELARVYNLNIFSLFSRISRGGPIEKALTQAPRRR